MLLVCQASMQLVRPQIPDFPVRYKNSYPSLILFITAFKRSSSPLIRSQKNTKKIFPDYISTRRIRISQIVLYQSLSWVSINGKFRFREVYRTALGLFGKASLQVLLSRDQCILAIRVSPVKRLPGRHSPTVTHDSFAVALTA